MLIEIDSISMIGPTPFFLLTAADAHRDGGAVKI